MEVVQAKLRDCREKGAMNSFERLSTQLHMRDGETETGNEPMDALVAEQTATESPAKGENKVPKKKLRKQKHALQMKHSHEERRKSKPRYFCQF